MGSERLTTRRIMLFVVVVALALGLVWPLVSSIHHPNWHLHTYVIQTPSGRYSTIPQPTREPIVSQFMRRLTGRDLGEIRHCGASWGKAEEVCALEHPEIAVGGGKPPNFRPLPGQVELADRMNAEIKRKEVAREPAKPVQSPAGQGQP